jgi:hypothetical protein
MTDPISGAITGRALVRAAASEPEFTPEARDFLDRVSGGARREVSAWIGDHFRVRRLNAQLKLLEKAERLLREAGREPREVKWNVLFPLLEHSSIEEDDEMANRWAALLATAADPAGNDLPPAFPDVLHQLCREDAVMLDYVVDRG